MTRKKKSTPFSWPQEGSSSIKPSTDIRKRFVRRITVQICPWKAVHIATGPAIQLTQYSHEAASIPYGPRRSFEITKTCHKHSFRALNSLNIWAWRAHLSTCSLLPVMSMTVVSTFIVAWSAALVDWHRRSAPADNALTPSAGASLFCIMPWFSFIYVMMCAHLADNLDPGWGRAC